MAEGIRLQEIREFAVQICHARTNNPVGTGFVAREGIVTCAHVVRKANRNDAGIEPKAADGLEVGFIFQNEEVEPAFRREPR